MTKFLNTNMAITRRRTQRLTAVSRLDVHCKEDESFVYLFGDLASVRLHRAGVIVKSSGSPAKRVTGLPKDDSVDLLIDRCASISCSCLMQPTSFPARQPIRKETETGRTPREDRLVSEEQLFGNDAYNSDADYDRREEFTDEENVGEYSRRGLGYL